MASFSPFPALRYAPGIDPALVAVPPYDVIDPSERARLAARHDRSAVRIDLPDLGVEGAEGDPYLRAARDLDAWISEGTLRADDRPTFSVYRMRYADNAGRRRATTGVIGALGLAEAGTDILPHEHTTPKARSDRLELLRATRANLSAIWGLSLARGLTDLLDPDGPPLLDYLDDDGVEHTLWRLDDPDKVAAVAALVAGAPIVIADGHHRFETSLAYAAERAQQDGDPGAAGATLAYVVELVDDELDVQAIHRLVDGLGDDPTATLDAWFEPVGAPPTERAVTDVMTEQGCLCVVDPRGEHLVRPRPDALRGARDLDSSRLQVALDALGITDVRYQHGVDHVRAAVRDGSAAAGILLRPATVYQIEATAHGGQRMPPKTTFFYPKPRTGLVFRLLD